MKKLFWSILCCLLFWNSYGQTARIRFTAEQEVKLIHAGRHAVIKADSSLEVVLNGKDLYDEVFRLNFVKVPFFLEAGDDVEVIWKSGGKPDIQNDGSRGAVQNLWIQRMEDWKTRLFYAGIMKEVVPEQAEKLTLEMVCDSLQAEFEDFLKQHPQCSDNFRKVVATELKYFPIYKRYRIPQSRATFYAFSPDTLAVLSQVVADAKDGRVAYSPSYWQTLLLYTDYLRIEDPEKRIKGKRLYLDELELARYYAPGEVRNRLMYENLKNITYWVKPDERKQLNRCLKQMSPYYAALLRKELDKAKWAKQADIVKIPQVSGENVQGEQVNLADFRGSWILLDIWATWCGPCCEEIPYLAAMEKKLAGRNITFVSISVDKKADQQKWLDKVRKEQMEGVQLHWTGKREELNKQFNIRGIPHFAIIDPRGKLRWNHLPSVSYGMIYHILKKHTNRLPSHHAPRRIKAQDR